VGSAAVFVFGDNDSSSTGQVCRPRPGPEAQGEGTATIVESSDKMSTKTGTMCCEANALKSGDCRELSGCADVRYLCHRSCNFCSSTPSADLWSAFWQELDTFCSVRMSDCLEGSLWQLRCCCGLSVPASRWGRFAPAWLSFHTNRCAFFFLAQQRKWCCCSCSKTTKEQRPGGGSTWGRGRTHDAQRT
jgi:hypothetical protein